MSPLEFVTSLVLFCSSYCSAISRPIRVDQRDVAIVIVIVRIAQDPDHDHGPDLASATGDNITPSNMETKALGKKIYRWLGRRGARA
jgi:hypothetical protein